MTDTLIDRADSGEIPRLHGEDRTVIIHFDTGEKTKNLREDRDAILAATGRMRHSDAVPKSLVTGHGYDPEAGRVIELDDTVTFHVSQPADMADAQPIAPWERVADTQRLTILAALGDFTGPQIPPTPDPVPPPPPPTPSRGYVGRHRDPWDRVAILGDGTYARLVEAAKPAGEPRRLRVQVGVGAFVFLLAAVTVTVLAVFW